MPIPTNLKPWKITNTKIIHQTPRIQIKEDACQAGEQNLEYTYTKRVDEGPLIIAEDADQKIWLVRQYRHPIKKIIWQFPAEGKLPEENWQTAAERGLHEELNLQAEHWHHLGLFHPDPGGLEQQYHAYLATHLTPAPEPADHHGSQEVENLEVHSFSRSEIDMLIDSGELCDNWTLAGLFLYDRFRRG